MVDQFRPEHRSQVRLRHRHAHRGAKTLTKRPGGGLDAEVRLTLGMARGDGAPLPEGTDVVQADGEAAEVEQRVQQHRPMAVAEHEAVAIRPSRSIGVDAEMAAPHDRSNVGHAHRHPGMAALGLLHGIDRQDPDGVYGELFGIHEPEGYRLVR
jgi:hypothetical protein